MYNNNELIYVRVRTYVNVHTHLYTCCMHCGNVCTYICKLCVICICHFVLCMCIYACVLCMHVRMCVYCVCMNVYCGYMGMPILHVYIRMCMCCVCTITIVCVCYTACGSTHNMSFLSLHYTTLVQTILWGQHTAVAPYTVWCSPFSTCA